MEESKNLVIYSGDDDWSALYVDGSLEEVGDHYMVIDAALGILGVERVASNDFLRGGDSREDVASSLDEIEEYRELKARGEAEPQLLEAYAEDLYEESAILQRRASILREAAEKSRLAGEPTAEARKLMEDLKGSLRAC